MVQVLEEAQKEVLIKFLEAAKKEKLDKSKNQTIQAKLRKVKGFAKKREYEIDIKNLKNRLDAQSYGINFRIY
ncbi:MAG: hypothetical protein EU531_09600 [Promethearchaeota archaeon]|nr:MAG: hypothetical protein EU531_09600 [Candidatus Lokiarchaeota archaeon]